MYPLTLWGSEFSEEKSNTSDIIVAELKKHLMCVRHGRYLTLALKSSQSSGREQTYTEIIKIEYGL